MTDSIDVANLPTADETRRDQWGRYLVVPPGRTKPVGYTRVTTVAKTLDSGGGLAPWKATMTACGIIMRRGLRAQWEALLAAHADPWYANADAKNECKRLVEESAAVGGANDRREVGSALHAITALADQGKALPHLTAETEREVNAYRTGLALAGIDVDVDNVELTVVLDDWQVAGTFDRLAHVPGFDLPLVADLKTGADLAYSWQPIAVQLAAYSRADAIYVQGAAKDGTQDRRLPMPPVDQEHGLVFWLPAGDAELRVFVVDLVAGWDAFHQSMWTRGWRNNRTLTTLLSEHPSQQPSATQVGDGEAIAAGVTKEDVVLTRQLEQSVAAIETTRSWLQERIDLIGKHEHARNMLRDNWPTGIPTLRSAWGHTQEELATIERLLDAVEQAHDLGFPTLRPVPNN